IPTGIGGLVPLCHCFLNEILYTLCLILLPALLTPHLPAAQPFAVAHIVSIQAKKTQGAATIGLEQTEVIARQVFRYGLTSAGRYASWLRRRESLLAAYVQDKVIFVLGKHDVARAIGRNCIDHLSLS